MNINILDCTLRDGGHVNNANFGENTIKGIIKHLALSKVEIIELGFLKNGTFDRDHAFFSKIEDTYHLLPEASQKQEYSLMIRPDWYDINQLTKCNGKINNLRFAFYYKDIALTREQCKYAEQNGYRVFLNPVNIMSYSDSQLKLLLKELNSIHPYAVSIVDTFGSMMKKDLIRLYKTFEKHLSKDISICLHLHENMSLSFSLAQEFIEIRKSNRNIYIDGSLLGMGRIPGNLCIEMLMEYLNDIKIKQYSMSNIYDAIHKYIEPIKNKTTWGYSPAYFLTAKYKMHRSYAEFLLDKKCYSHSDINKMLQKIITQNDKDNFNESLIKHISDSYDTEKGSN